jgi:hypothetical protein
MAQNRRKTWTMEDDERLRQLSSSGASVATIAKDLGRTESAVLARAYAIGVAFRRLKTRRRTFSKWG